MAKPPARRGTTLRSLVIEGLEQVTAGGAPTPGTAPKLSEQKATVIEVGRHGIPALRRPGTAKPATVARGMVDTLRDELGADPLQLPDVSARIALCDRTREFHEVATDWFAENRSEGWATCT